MVRLSVALRYREVLLPVLCAVSWTHCDFWSFRLPKKPKACPGKTWAVNRDITVAFGGMADDVGLPYFVAS